MSVSIRGTTRHKQRLVVLASPVVSLRRWHGSVAVSVCERRDDVDEGGDQRAACCPAAAVAGRAVEVPQQAIRGPQWAPDKPDEG